MACIARLLFLSGRAAYTKPNKEVTLTEGLIQHRQGTLTEPFGWHGGKVALIPLPIEVC